MMYNEYPFAEYFTGIGTGVRLPKAIGCRNTTCHIIAVSHPLSSLLRRSHLTLRTHRKKSRELLVGLAPYILRGCGRYLRLLFHV